MNAKFNYVNLGHCENVFEIPCECSFDSVITLPDYCPEIKKILKTAVNINNVSTQNTADSISVRADVIVRIIYVGDNGEISAYEQLNSINKTVETSVAPDCFIRTNISTEYINTRAVNQRKIEVRVMSTIKFKGVRKKDEKILTDVSGEGVQSICDEYNYSFVNGIAEKTFSLTETVELEKDKPTIKAIINNFGYVSINDIKVINNKALLKGVCRVTIHYFSESSSIVEVSEHSLPVNQIIEADGIDEKSIINHSVNILSFEAIPKLDASGELRLLELNLKLSGIITGYEQKILTLIKDCYSTTKSLNAASKKLEILEYVDSFDSSFLNKVVFESIGVSVSSVLSVWCSDLKCSYSLSNNNCLLSGTYNVTVIYLDSDKQIGIIQKTVDFENTFNITLNTERIVVDGNVQLLGCSCSVTGESRLELKSEISVNCVVLSSRCVDYISEITLDENSEIKENTYPLILYCCNAGENVWEIAKRYNTTLEAIKYENDLTEDIIAESRILLIPGV